jgi:hypothetical protein
MDAITQFLDATLGRPDTRWQAEPLDDRGVVVRYTAGERSAVAKFFGRKRGLDGTPFTPERARWWMQLEYATLIKLERAGLTAGAARIVRPLGCAPELEALLLTEHIRGEAWGARMQRQFLAGDRAGLGAAVEQIALLLARLHGATQAAAALDPGPNLEYWRGVLDQLAERGAITAGQGAALRDLLAGWQGSGELGGDGQCRIHGDATPANLLFTPGGLVAIDLERSRCDDPAIDLGCVAAELKHWLLRWSGDRHAAEGLIGRLYHCYAGQRGLDAAEFGRLTRRGQFYLGGYLLRISRNAWLDLGYRRHLIDEALACLHR